MEGHLLPRYLLKSTGFEAVSGTLFGQIAYMLDKSVCLAILYGCPNWVFGSIYLEMTGKFHPTQSPIQSGHPYTQENRLNVQEDFWHLPWELQLLVRLLGSLILGPFPLCWARGAGGRKIWLAARMGHGPTGEWTGPKVGAEPVGDTWTHDRGKGPWPKDLFQWHTHKINQTLWYSLSDNMDS